MKHRYVLPQLPYSYGALEPYIDTDTMKVHHQGHHKKYVEKLNEAIAKHPTYNKTIEELLMSPELLPPDIQKAVIQNGGGHANHSLWWTILTPQSTQRPVGKFMPIMQKHFGSLEHFKEKFTEVAEKHFGSGWAWLCTNKTGNLSIFSTHDHENPISRGLTPLLVLDLWEHAYYLKHQNRRAEYIQAFWPILNWEEVGKRWEEFVATGGVHREWRIAG